MAAGLAVVARSCGAPTPRDSGYPWTRALRSTTSRSQRMGLPRSSAIAARWCRTSRLARRPITSRGRSRSRKPSWAGGLRLSQSWIKLHTEILTDPKILRLHPYGRLAWIGLLLLARNGNPPGTWSISAATPDAAAEDLVCALQMGDQLQND